MRRLFLLACAALVLAAPAARATLALDLSVPELTQRSDVVVRGRVVDQRVGWDELHRHPITRTVIQPERVLKGHIAKQVVIRQVGGDLDGIHLHIPGDTVLRVGEEVVVFAEKHPTAPGEFVLEGMSEGKFTVVHTLGQGDVVTRDLHGLALARRQPNGLIGPSSAPPKVGARMPYALLVKGVAEGLRLPPVAPVRVSVPAARTGR